jgi:hypothetical protein
MAYTTKSSAEWTAEELRRAVADSRTWRQVGRRLGFPTIDATIRRSLQNDSAALGLDTRHFTNRRSWTDDQLVEAAGRTCTWPELTEALGLKDYAENRTVIKGHAVRLGLDLRHLSAPGAKLVQLPTALDDYSYAPEHLRRSAPSLAMAWFLSRGCTPSLPVEPEPYDLIINTHMGFQRVQVKSTTCLQQGDWSVTVGHRTDKKTPLLPYTNEEIDLFCIVDGDLNLYLLPLAAIGGRVRIGLRPYKLYIIGNARGLLT